MENTEFYIGWMANAPNGFAKFIKKYLLVLSAVIIVLAILLAVSQKKFSTGNFEFGQLTEVNGIYFDAPVPCIKVINGKDIWGNLSYMTIPLIGYGKHGADGIISDIEKEKNISLNQKQVGLKGTLLFNDGKTLLQIDKNDTPVTKISSVVVTGDLLPVIKDLGIQTVKGEIVDSKCYFGVMKPGEGKPHRDCAIRCILGGIPPVLAVQNEKGEGNYYLIVGANGEKINEKVQSFVAEPVSIEAKLVQYDDWIVMYVQDEKKIKSISYLQMKLGNSVQLCVANCIK
ncbi:MAG TPA: hypothetical protein VHZ50_18965 [Puia sp.]|nr:hypothetical protein [Puia sp.]